MHTVMISPTYQELESLPLLVAKLEDAGVDLLIVDDASPDGTGALADSLASTRPWMHVLHREGKDGLGAAYRAGFAWALARDYDAIGQIDADLSHPPDSIADLQSALADGADLAIGSRYIEGGGTVGWSRRRELLSRIGCTLTGRTLETRIRDVTGGFKLWRAEALRTIEVGSTGSQGFVFQVETTLRAERAGLTIREVPFWFHERAVGTSKMNAGIALEGIGRVLRLRRELAVATTP